MNNSVRKGGEYTEEEINRWVARPDFNPRTGRRIKESGTLFRKLRDLATATTGQGREKREDVLSSRPLLAYFKRTVRDEVSSKALLTKIDRHVRRAVASYDDPLPLARTIEDMDIPAPLSYSDTRVSSLMYDLTVTNCHDGQKKLTMSLLEFVAESLARLECSPEDVLLVYAGASGLAAAVASCVFPGLKLVLFEPSDDVLTYTPAAFKNTIVIRTPLPSSGSDNSNWRRNNVSTGSSSVFTGKEVVIFTGRAGWFDDSAAHYCRHVFFPASGKTHILFTSDIRKGKDGNTDEVEIAQDMRDQMRWTMQTGCSAYMHKFRFPYLDDANEKEIVRRYHDLTDLPAEAFDYKPSRRAKASDGGDFRMPYLDGLLYIQLYARQRSLELRLIGFAQDPLAPVPSKRYSLRDYDNVEDKMTTFNAFYRTHARYASASSEGLERIDDDELQPPESVPAFYEIMAEYLIAAKCVACTGCLKPVSAIHDIIRDYVGKFSKKTPLTCHLISAAKHLQQNKNKKKSKGKMNGDKRAEEEEGEGDGNDASFAYAKFTREWADRVSRLYPEAAVPAEFRAYSRFQTVI